MNVKLNHLKNSLPPVPYKKARILKAATKRVFNLIKFKNIWHWLITNGRAQDDSPDVAVDENGILHVILGGDERIENVAQTEASIDAYRVSAGFDLSCMNQQLISIWANTPDGFAWMGLYPMDWSDKERELDSFWQISNNYNINTCGIYSSLDKLTTMLENNNTQQVQKGLAS
jgi:hypothetical protein